MKRTLTLLIFLLFVTGLPNSFAEMKLFIREYSYRADEHDSRDSSRTVALRVAKNILLDELGTYLERSTKGKGVQLAKDEIASLTSVIVKTEIVSETWDGRVYRLKARIETDSDEVVRSIDTLRKDPGKVNELETVAGRATALLKENEGLRKELIVSAGAKRKDLTERYAKTIKELTAIDWFEKGCMSSMTGYYNDAIGAFSKAIMLNPEFAIAYYNRGVAHTYLVDDTRAIQDYDKAIALNPQYAMAYCNRGTAYAYRENYRQAIRDLDKGIELNEKYAKAYYNRGAAHAHLGNDSQAIKDFTKAIDLNPKYAVAYYSRGIIFRRLLNDDKALADHKAAAGLGHQEAKNYLGTQSIGTR